MSADAQQALMALGQAMLRLESRLCRLNLPGLVLPVPGAAANLDALFAPLFAAEPADVASPLNQHASRQAPQPARRSEQPPSAVAPGLAAGLAFAAEAPTDWQPVRRSEQPSTAVDPTALLSAKAMPGVGPQQPPADLHARMAAGEAPDASRMRPGRARGVDVGSDLNAAPGHVNRQAPLPAWDSEQHLDGQDSELPGLASPAGPPAPGAWPGLQPRQRDHGTNGSGAPAGPTGRAAVSGLADEQVRDQSLAGATGREPLLPPAPGRVQPPEPVWQAVPHEAALPPSELRLTRGAAGLSAILRASIAPDGHVAAPLAASPETDQDVPPMPVAVDVDELLRELADRLEFAFLRMYGTSG